MARPRDLFEAIAQDDLYDAVLDTAKDARSTSSPHAKQPKVQIKREKTSVGFAYRIYMGAGLTAASAREGAKRLLVVKLQESRVPEVPHLIDERTIGLDSSTELKPLLAGAILSLCLVADN